MDNKTLTPEEKAQQKEAFRFAIMVLTGVSLLGVFITMFAFMQVRGIGSSVAMRATIELGEAERFFMSSCATCHGRQGEGGGLIDAPPLNQDGDTWQLTDAEMMTIMRDGKGEMPALRSGNSDKELQKLVRYIKRWWTHEQRAQQPN
ncbi:cytochrome c [Anaerolineales bacterium HSG6]|nr:cytochrome c [Anaerolineales bacterium HSG6]